LLIHYHWFCPTTNFYISLFNYTSIFHMFVSMTNSTSMKPLNLSMVTHLLSLWPYPWFLHLSSMWLLTFYFYDAEEVYLYVIFKNLMIIQLFMTHSFRFHLLVVKDPPYDLGSSLVLGLFLHGMKRFLVCFIFIYLNLRNSSRDLIFPPL